jgi:hypothetical protein
MSKIHSSRYEYRTHGRKLKHKAGKQEPKKASKKESKKKKYLQRHQEVGNGGVNLTHSCECAERPTRPLALLPTPECLVRSSPNRL